jgi:hypothetical protein
MAVTPNRTQRPLRVLRLLLVVAGGAALWFLFSPSAAQAEEQPEPLLEGSVDPQTGDSLKTLGRQVTSSTRQALQPVLADPVLEPFAGIVDAGFATADAVVDSVLPEKRTPQVDDPRVPPSVASRAPRPKQLLALVRQSPPQPQHDVQEAPRSPDTRRADSARARGPGAAPTTHDDLLPPPRLPSGPDQANLSAGSSGLSLAVVPASMLVAAGGLRARPLPAPGLAPRAVAYDPWFSPD